MNTLLPENTADLRALYRLAEARSARLRLLFDSARALATVEDDRVEHQLQLASQRAAHFLGYANGRLLRDLPTSDGLGDTILELTAPAGLRPCAYLVLDGPSRGALQQEDAESVAVLRQLMAARLASLHREEEREHLLLELADREMRLALLVERMIADDERARRRLAADLHDGVAQVASAALRRLENVDDVRAQLPPAAVEDLNRGLELVRQTVRELRSLIQGLRPATLESLGLAAALHEELPRLIDLPVRLVANDVRGVRPDPDVEIALFRTAQEAVHNIRKHARACARVDVKLDVSSSGVTLEIVNDGERVDALALDAGAAKGSSGGLGLVMMRERIAAIGGNVRIEPGRHGGVRVEINVPGTRGADAST